jgi:mannose-6-phosphate isomerase
MTTKFIDHRPWGFYEILRDGTDFKIKRIVVYPGKRMSLQRHFYRREHWYILAGEAAVTCRNEQIFMKKGDFIDIPVKVLHRVLNSGTDDLVFIEIQSGEPCREDDIERIEDDYGRI